MFKMESTLLSDEDYQEFQDLQLEIQTETHTTSQTDEEKALTTTSNLNGDTSNNNETQNEAASNESKPFIWNERMWNIKNGIKKGLVIAKLFENENPSDYFSSRDNLVEDAVKDCKNKLLSFEDDGDYIGAWLLTEINLWDNEKERLILLSGKFLVIVKYDFIALKLLEFKKIPLNRIDTIVNGELVYPANSLIPRINGIAHGVSNAIRGCILERWSNNDKGPTSSFVDLSNFEARDRGVKGIRLMWNEGRPIPFTQRWNPFSEDIPFDTYTSHPLFWHKDYDPALHKTYDVHDFSLKVMSAVENARSSHFSQMQTTSCKIYHKPIVLQNYVGIGSVIHNKNALGFFKVRGKFSF